MSIGLITGLMFLCMLSLMVTGQPMAFVIGSVGAFFAITLWGVGGVDIAYFCTWDVMGGFLWVVGPMFIFMGIVLEKSGIADDLFEAIYRWMGPVRGGLGIGTVFICMIFAAMSGVSGAATVTMGLIALPAMLKRGYDKRMITGLIQAGGALGVLIPPSIIMVIYGMIARVSIARLFLSGVFPGILLGILYIIYIGIRCYLQPLMGPPLPKSERATWGEKFVSLRAAIQPIVLIVLVMGLLMLGVTSITEASAVGAFGSLICAAVNRKLRWKVVEEACERTLLTSCMIAWILIAGFLFSKVYDGLGAGAIVSAALSAVGGKWGTMAIIQLSFFILGAFLDDTALLLICAPVYLPLVRVLGFDPVWFGTLYVINMQMAYLTPPFGYNLFYMKSIVPPEITLKDIYLSVIPFVALQALGLAIVVIFPQIALWLPNVVFGR